MEEVIIIGGGLTGLSIAHYLKKENISFKVLEAQNRVGGRIETINGNHKTPMEMGATWFSEEHTNLIHLLSELNVGYFEQYTEGIALFETMSFEPPQQYFVPANSHSAYRIHNGTHSIIAALCKNIGNENVALNTEITSIEETGDSIKITDSFQNTFFCKFLIVAIPPKLLSNSIQFIPKLPQAFNKVTEETQTWMSDSIKFSIEYKSAFWRKNNFSGSVFSQSGLATEIYDHCNLEQTKFALKGFLNGSAINYSFEQRKEKVIAQLKYLLGNEATNFETYNDKIWNNKYIKPKNDTFLFPHQNNGHLLYKDVYMNNKLFFSGTETSSSFSGYMEGAVISANLISQKIIKTIKK